MEMVQADRIPTAETLGHNEDRMPPKTKEPNLLAQGHGFVVEESFGLLRSFASLTCFGLSRRGHRLFGNVEILW